MARDEVFWSELNRLFTVVCEINDEGVIQSASSLLRQHCQLDNKESANFFELFRFKRPTGFDGTFHSALKYQGSLFLGFNTAAGFAIRGQFIDFSHQGISGLCFVGVPWLWWMESNAPNTRLAISDFPVHDVQMDQLFFMSTQQNMVDDLQALNAQLKTAQEKLEKANQARQSYFHHVSHEMRTPLNGVISALTLLQDDGRDERSRELIRLASHSANRLLEVINFTLETASAEATTERDEKVFDLDALLEESLAVVQPKALEKGLELSRAGQLSFQFPYKGNARLLRQVLTNLLGNAVKFSDTGVVALGARVRHSPDADVDIIRFTVADEGPGIPEEAQAAVFQPFATGVSVETQRQGGTGLGLSIVQRFVEVLGGKIELASAPGEGAVFSFDVPLTRADRSELPGNLAPVKGDALHFDGCVLLADDMQTNRVLNAKVLESLGIRVVSVCSGREAVEYLRAHPQGVDLIIMDLEMPDMDGYEAAQLIRSEPAIAHTPIIALSAHVGEAERRRAIAAGMNNFMAKPLVRDEVISELRDWLDLSTAAPSKTEANLLSSVSQQSRDNEQETANPVGGNSVASSDAVFDPSKVEGLLNDVGETVTRTLIDKFLSESSARWERLREAIEAADTEVVLREAHTLGSSCFTFGIVHAGQRFRAIEAAASAGNAGSPEDLQAIAGPLAEGIGSLQAMIVGAE